jgi:hypothetical protein
MRWYPRLGSLRDCRRSALGGPPHQGSDTAKDGPPLGLRPRGVRGTVGLVFLALAGWMPLWPLSVLAAWFGASHLVRRRRDTVAGLLVKELKLREAIERVLILCPAPLTIQWQDEMLRWSGRLARNGE